MRECAPVAVNAPSGEGAPADLAGRRLLGDREVVIGDPAMARAFDLLERLGASDLPVLIMGETGAGKEHAAWAVHHHSRRSARPFVPLNCAALPETLVESELFGHDRGAFSGAVTARAGLLENVAGGTLFLDEVGELALPAQAKLLRALDMQRVMRLGEHRERVIDVRVVAATHRVLEDEVRAGRFRQDLFFRLAAARVALPPLRDRPCEIPLLFREFANRAARKAGRSAPDLTPEAMAELLAHGWPGNVRELKHVAEYVVATVTGDAIGAGDLPGQLAEWRMRPPAAPPAGVSIAGAGSAAAMPRRRLADEVHELERRRMAEALAATRGVKTHAARLLGMPIRTFTWKLRPERDRARRRRARMQAAHAALPGSLASAGGHGPSGGHSGHNSDSSGALG